MCNNGISNKINKKLSPEEQFKNAVENYKPNLRYEGIIRFPVFMFGENETSEEKFQKLIEWSDSINETEFADYLRDIQEKLKKFK